MPLRLDYTFPNLKRAYTIQGEQKKKRAEASASVCGFVSKTSQQLRLNLLNSTHMWALLHLAFQKAGLSLVFVCSHAHMWASLDLHHCPDWCFWTATRLALIVIFPFVQSHPMNGTLELLARVYWVPMIRRIIATRARRHTECAKDHALFQSISELENSLAKGITVVSGSSFL